MSKTELEQILKIGDIVTEEKIRELRNYVNSLKEGNSQLETQYKKERYKRISDLCKTNTHEANAELAKILIEPIKLALEKQQGAQSNE